MPKRFGFGKKEKLKSRKQIEELFLTGKSFGVFPLRVIYKFSQDAEEGAVQVGVTANKKTFKRAVERNRIKRLLREAYRLEKPELIEEVKKNKKQLFIFFIYTDKTIASFHTIRDAMKKALYILVKKVA